MPVVEALTLGAETVLPEPAPTDSRPGLATALPAGALVEETGLIARWLATPGVRIVSVTGSAGADGWTEPLRGAGRWTSWAALARSARLASDVAAHVNSEVASELGAEANPPGKQLLGRAAVDRRDRALQPVFPGRKPLGAAG